MVNMEKLRILMAIMVLFMWLPVEALAGNNPFDKNVNINIGSDNEWRIKDKTATRSGSDSGDFYHLFYDRKQLRLRITDGAEDSEASARQYQNFSVEDVQVDGKRLPLFQWCLINQPKHSRFLQQGLKVKQGVCSNRGEKGAFNMRLNVATLEALKNGQTLSFMIKPFRSSMTVNFDISDFLDVTAKLSTRVKPVHKAPEPGQVVQLDKVIAVEMCKANPPKGFATIKSVEYDCKDAAAKTRAEASIEGMVTKERKRKAQVAESERKRKEAEAAKKWAEKKAAEEKLAAEQAALAEVEASKQVINAEITNKMLAVCMKKWESGEHRCYCEKFIAHAPAGIESDPSCSAQ